MTVSFMYCITGHQMLANRKISQNNNCSWEPKPFHFSMAQTKARKLRWSIKGLSWICTSNFKRDYSNSYSNTCGTLGKTGNLLAHKGHVSESLKVSCKQASFGEDTHVKADEWVMQLHPKAQGLLRSPQAQGRSQEGYPAGCRRAWPVSALAWGFMPPWLWDTTFLFFDAKETQQANLQNHIKKSSRHHFFFTKKFWKWTQGKYTHIKWSHWNINSSFSLSLNNF